ncbi:MAG: radical SAM protein [Candidatus Dadabacteria bacterium]|nr:radical SAM protein [Candidatus Dadabacteria bacterium]
MTGGMGDLKCLASPWRITFDTNPDDCNLGCVMCEEHSAYSPRKQARASGRVPRRRMSIETVERVIEECAPAGLREIIPSTMGEPLMYKHMPRIIDLCRKHGVKMNLTTNGTFPGLGAQRWAELIVPIGSDVKISWNGADAQSQSIVMVGNNFEKNLENLRTFVRTRDRHAAGGGNYCSVTLQMTFMEMNLPQVPQVVELAVAEGVDRVKGHHLWAHFREIAGQDLRRNSDSITRWNTIARQCRRIAEERRLPNGKRIRLENIYEIDPGHGGELHPDARCPFLGQEAWVNHAGRFDPCCAPDTLRRTLGDFGNVSGKGLLPIWNSPEYKDLIKDYMRHEVCRKCNMRKPPLEFA